MATEKRLIDANDVVKKLEYEIENLCPPVPTNPDVISATEAYIRRVLPKLVRNVIDYINRQPTVDAVEVVHGRWEDMYGGKYANPRYRCSVCKKTALYRFEKNGLNKWEEVQELTPICPYCMAKLDGGNNNDI